MAVFALVEASGDVGDDAIYTNVCIIKACCIVICGFVDCAVAFHTVAVSVFN